MAVNAADGAGAGNGAAGAEGAGGGNGETEAIVAKLQQLLQESAKQNLETSAKIVPEATKRQIAGALPKQ